MAFIFSLLLLSLASAVIVVTIALGDSSAVPGDSGAYAPKTDTLFLDILFGKKEKVCTEEHCLIKGVSIIKTMDRNVNPCDDFYKFACGGWIEDNDVNDDSETAIFGKLQNKIFKKLDRLMMDKATRRKVPIASQKAISSYKVCRKLQKLPKSSNNFYDLVGEFGGSNLTDNFDEKMSIEERLATAIRSYALGPLFVFQPLPNDVNTTENILAMAPPSIPTATGDPYKDVVLLEQIFKMPTSRFVLYLQDLMFILTAIKGNMGNMTFRRIFEKEKIFLRSEGKEAEKPVILQIKDFSTVLSKKINWIKFFEIMLKDSKPDGTTPNENEIKERNITVQNPEVINTIIDHFANFSNSSSRLADFLAISFILNHPLLIFPYLHTVLEEEMQISEVKEKLVCLDTVGQYLSYALDYIYVDYETNSKFETSKNARHLISHIKKAFKKLIANYNWLDERSRKNLEEKLHNLKYYLGFPTWIKDTEELDRFYEKFPFPSESEVHLAESYGNMVKFGVKQMWKQLYMKNSRDEFPVIPGLSITIVNAFYVPHLNVFVLPLAIQNPPFYDERNPEYLTFGSIGSVIGHEIIHGYDPNGILRGNTGNLADELDEETKEEYDERASCFINLYNTYNVTDKTNINGLMTLAENVADSGGVRSSFYAYKHWLKVHPKSKEMKLPLLQNYTNDQMFFLAYAQTWCASTGKGYLEKQAKEDVHAANRYRVIGTLSSSREFAEAYKCPVGSKMNPGQTKCELF